MAQRRTGSEHIRKIDFVFYNEGHIREAVAEARNEPKPPGRNGSGTSDPTASEAIRNATPVASVTLGGRELERPEEWLRVVRATYEWCDIIRLAVARGRYSGVDYRETCARLCLSQATYSRYLRDVREHALLCAVQIGLVRMPLASSPPGQRHPK